MADAPISYTTHYNLSKWAEGSNPGAVALNSQWDLIDNVIYLKENPLSFGYPLSRASNVISLNINATNLKLTSNALDTIQSIAITATPQFAKIGIGGAAPTSVYIAKIYGSQNVTGDLVVDGGLQVNGTLTFLNSDTLQVEDKNIEMGKVTTPTDTTANGGGITLLGATNKTIIWDSTNLNWTSSEHWNLASGKSYKSNNVVVIDSSRQGFLSKLGINTATIASGDVISINGNTKSIGDIYSGNWSQGAEPYIGYYIGQNGSAFGKLNTTELHVKNFIADQEQALAGWLSVTKSSAKLASDFTIGASVGSTATLTVEEIEGYTGQVFANNDNIRMSVITRGSSSLTVADIWGTVVYIGRVAATKTQTYTFTKTSGSGTSVSKGAIAKDYGLDGDGVIELVAINELGKQSYMQTKRFNSATLTTTIQSRLGDITGITSDTWGALSGQGLYSQRGYLEKDVYIAESVTIGGRSLGVMQGQTALFHFDTNLQDSLNGIKPVYTGAYNETDYGLITATGLVCTKATGKFGGGVAVEEATTNLFTTLDVAAWSNFDGNGTAVNAGDGWYELQSAEASDPLKRGSFTAPSTGSCTFSALFRNGNSSSITFYLDIRDSSSTAVTLAAGETRRVTLTQTISNVSAWVDIRSTAALTKLYIKNPQIEFKAYATSFTQGARAAGQLNYSNVLNPSAFTVITWAYIDLSKSLSNGHILELSSDANNRLRINRNGTTNYLTFVFRKNSSDLISLSSSTTTITAGWHQLALTFSGSAYTLYVDSSAYYPSQNVSTQINPDFILRLGHSYAAASHGNCIYDDTAVFNRALTQEEINKIYGSNQPFSESLQLTRIDGSQIVTGKLASQNWQSLVAGTQLDLNKGYLELNNGTTNLFKFDSQAGTAKISTFDFTDKLLNNPTLGITIGDYTGVTKTSGIWLGQRTVTGINVRELVLTDGSANTISFMSTSAGAVFGTISTTNFILGLGNLASAVSGGTGFGLEGRISGSTMFKLATDGNKIAAFGFDQNILKYTQTINSVAYDTIKLGSFTGDPTDVSTDISSTLLPEGAINTTTQYNAWTLYAPDWTDRLRYNTSIFYGASGGSFGFDGYDGAAKPSTFYARWMIEKTSISAYLGKTIEINYRAMWSTAEPTVNPTVSFTIISWWFHPTLSQWRIIKTKVDKRTAPNQGSWNQFTFQFAIPPNTEKLQFYVELEYPSQTLVNACNVDDITIKEYGTTQTWISSEGFQVRSSPLSYLKLQYGKFDIATASLKVNGFDAATWGGVISDATRPTNPVDGLFVYNSTTSKLEFYNGSGWRTVTTA
jgi:hypothetical protein